MEIINVSNSLYDENNYRPVSIISILAKTFKSLVDLHYGHLFHFHDNQFGFCDGGGCNKAMFAFTNSVRYFRNRHNNIYVAALDVTKAFDRVNQFNVLQCLLECGFPVKLVHVFCQWYRNLKSCVLWGNGISKCFSIKSGCPQGSILEPKFFNFVLDKLIINLESSHSSCFVGNCLAGAFTYADNIILLSGSSRQLQLMLDLCTSFGAILYLMLKSHIGVLLVY